MREQLKEIIENTAEPELITKAFEFAKSAHHGQKRFSGKDYIAHPLRVAQILSRLHLDSKTIAAGFLHDVPDDTEKTLEDIEKEFGKEVAFLVDGVSKLGKLRYPKEEVEPVDLRIKKPIDLRAESLRKMFFAMGKDLRVVLIKLADRLHNMETLNSVPREKRKRIALETLEIFAPLANRLGMGHIKGQLEDLAFPYLYPKEYQWLINNIKEKYEEREKDLKRIAPLLTQILEKDGVKIIAVRSRPKNYWSVYQKLLRYDMDFDRIYDLIALKVIVDDIKTCYETLGIIHQNWKPLPGRIKDYIAFPKPNGYQALHTTVVCFVGKILEVQIKTKRMEEEAKYGIAAHWALKEGINLKFQGKRFAWVQQLKDWQTNVSGVKEFLEGLKIDFFQDRIFVFTPKGDVIDLPESATSVDFAYAVHSDVGNQCAAAKVNGKLIQLSRPLKNGDVVKIIIDKNKKPSRDWLKFVKTNLARSHIKSSLKEKKQSQSLRGFFWKKMPKLKPLVPWKKEKKETVTVSLAGQTGMKIYLAKCCSPKSSNQIKAYVTKDRGAVIHKVDCKDIIEAEKKWPQKVIEATWTKTKS